MIKLIALDMDGTILLSDHKTIHPENIRAIREAQADAVIRGEPGLHRHHLGEFLG